MDVDRRPVLLTVFLIVLSVLILAAIVLSFVYFSKIFDDSSVSTVQNYSSGQVSLTENSQAIQFTVGSSATFGGMTFTLVEIVGDSHAVFSMGDDSGNFYFYRARSGVIGGRVEVEFIDVATIDGEETATLRFSLVPEIQEITLRVGETGNYQGVLVTLSEIVSNSQVSVQIMNGIASGQRTVSSEYTSRGISIGDTASGVVHFAMKLVRVETVAGEERAVLSIGPNEAFVDP
jgi:hypothetical protein